MKLKHTFYYSARIIIIIALVLLVYFNTIHHPFHYDDIGVAIKSDIIEVNLSDFWENNSGIFLHRLFLLYTFSLNYHWGEGSVVSYHIVNIIFHLLNSVLIYLILKNILVYETRFISIPFLSSLIFAVHPLNTETVTFISSRSSGMVTFFFLLSLYFFVQGTSAIYRLKERKNKTAFFYYTFSLAAFVLGLATKETIVTLPAIMLLYLYYFQNREKNLLKFLVKFKWHSIAIVFSVIVYLAYRKITGGAMFTALADAGMSLYGRYYYFLTELKVIILYYLKLFIFPVNLNIYPMMTPSTSIFDFLVFISLLIILFLVAFAVLVSWRKQQFIQSKIISFAIIWFFITLLPSSSFIPLNDLIAEHRVYLPAVGASIFFGTIFFNFISSLNRHVKLKFFGNLFLALILFLFSLLTIQRNSVWKDGYTLWKDSALKTPNYAKPHINLGVEYNNLGLNDLAVEEFKIAIKLLPDHSESHYNLGKVYSDLQQYESAISEFLLAIQYDTSNYTAMFGLGNAHSKIHRYDEAINAFQKANLAFRNINGKDYIEAIHNSGEVYGKMGKLNKAIELFQKVVEIDPDHILGNENLARGYKYLGDTDKADYYFKRTLYLKQRISKKHL